MAVAVPVWISGEGTIFDVCQSPGVIGAAFLEEDRPPGIFHIFDECRGAAAARLYQVAPFLIIGIGCLFFPKPKEQASDKS